MRNLKKLLAVIISVCVLATFAVPAFAETKTEIQICQDLGMVQGTTGGVTDAYKASTPARYQAAIMFLRLKGLEDEATAFIPTDNFSDLQGVNESNKAILGYLKANPNLGFEGIGNNKFDPLKPITAKEYYKVLLTALGYKENVDFTWATVFQFAASKGMFALVDNTNFTINDLAIGTVEALKLTVKGGTDTLIATLVDAGAITADKATATGLYTAVPKALTLVSATTDNLKTVKFVFNKELDKDTIKTANFSNTSDVKLSDDKKTVVAIVATKAQSDKLDITIDGVKASDGTKLDKTTQKITFVDTTVPVISGVTVKNAKTLVVNASEPMNFDYTSYQMFNDIKIDGSPMTASSTIDYVNNTVTFNLTSLLAKGTHKIDISGMKDFANYTAVATSFTFDVPEDTAAPEIKSAKMNNINQVEVTFNEDLDAVGDFKVNGNAPASVEKGDNNATYKLNLSDANKLNIGAIVEVKVEYKGQKDVIGNEVKDWKSTTFKVTDDTVLPTLTGKFDTGNKLVLTFSKSMLKAGTVKVYKSNGTDQLGSNVDMSATGTWETNNTVYKMDATVIGDDLAKTDAKDVVVKITGMKDATVRTNALADTTLTLKALDTKAPVVAPAYKITDDANKAENDTIVFYFNEAMDTTTLNNLSNYRITSGSGSTYAAGKTLSAISDVSVSSIASDGKSITIKAKDIGSTAGLRFEVIALKDVAGNYCAITPVSSQAAATLAVSTATAKEEKKIELVFNQDVGSFDPSVYAVRLGATTTSTYKAFVTGVSIDGAKVTLTLGDSIGTSTSGLYLVPQNLNLAKDIYGLAMPATSPALTLTDKIKPTASLEAKTTTTVAIKFSESAKIASVNAFLADLSVRKASDNSLVNITAGALDIADGFNGKVVTIKGLSANTEYKVAILPRSSVKDGDGNDLAELASTSVTTKSN